VKADYLINIVLTCKYMGWDWATYHRQPKDFIEVVNILRFEEANEANRVNKRNGN